MLHDHTGLLFQCKHLRTLKCHSPDDKTNCRTGPTKNSEKLSVIDRITSNMRLETFQGLEKGYFNIRLTANISFFKDYPLPTKVSFEKPTLKK